MKNLRAPLPGESWINIENTTHIPALACSHPGGVIPCPSQVAFGCLVERELSLEGLENLREGTCRVRVFYWHTFFDVDPKKSNTIHMGHH